MIQVTSPRLPRLSPGRPLPEEGSLRRPRRPPRPSLPTRPPFTRTASPGTGEDTWTAFLADYRPGARSGLSVARAHARRPPPIRRDLIKRKLYLVPNPSWCRGGARTSALLLQGSLLQAAALLHPEGDAALAEIDRPARPPPLLPGRPPLRRRPFAEALFEGMRGMGGCGRRPGPSVGPASSSLEKSRGQRPAQPLRRSRP